MTVHTVMYSVTVFFIKFNLCILNLNLYRMSAHAVFSCVKHWKRLLFADEVFFTACVHVLAECDFSYSVV